METTAYYHPSVEAVPLHVGIIPDGGRRWAKAHGCSLGESYACTRSFLQLLVEMFFNKGVQELSIYLSSIQNFRREPEDLEPYLAILESSLNNQITQLARHRQLRVVIAGNLDILPASLRTAIESIEQQTINYSSGRINLLLAYDPHEEIIKAVKSSGNMNEFITHLQITTPVDLVIRSGDAPLLSNFLPLQSAWARLYFTDKLFNDLTAEDVLQILRHFEKINRKFGN